MGTLDRAIGPSMKRRGLTRRYVLESALAYVDEHGLAALTMRRLGATLGVEGMSLYKHVADKDALLDGIVELLWAQAPIPSLPDQQWKEALRNYAVGLRALFHRHPNSAPLIVTRNTVNREMLCRYDAYAKLLRRSGFDAHGALEAVCAVTGQAIGFGLIEYRYREPSSQTESEIQRIRRVTHSLPDDLPDSQVELAVELAGDGHRCESCFTIGIETLLSGLNDRRAARSATDR